MNIYLKQAVKPCDGTDISMGIPRDNPYREGCRDMGPYT